MWKVCQLLKGGRSQISRSRNANSLSSPVQQFSSAVPLFAEDHVDDGRHRRRTTKRPIAFTPSLFRFFDHKNQTGCNHDLTRVLLAVESEHGGSNNKSESADNFSQEQREHEGGRRRPDHDQDGWECRCRCRFGDWLGFTTMVAATIHLSRTTIHLLPNNDENRELCRVDAKTSDGQRISIFADLKDAVQNGWRQFLFQAAPVLFPDVFKRWYVLPTTRQLRVISPSVQQPQEQDDITDKDTGAATACDESLPSTSSSPACISRTISTSGECAVQTDSVDVETPFDEFMLESGRRLAAFSRMTDVNLEHAIGVDMLKRRLYDEAIDYLLGAAKAGHAGAMYNLGICYSRGYGVRRDMTKAIEMWRTAADQGHGLSKYQMGVCHARGLGGLAMDHERAVRYMEAAASAGVPEAKTYLAAHEYKQGRMDGAFALLRQAIAAGDPKAQALMNDWPMANKCNHMQQEDDSDGYVFENLTPVEVELPVPSVAIKRINNGRRRFWASSSSEKEDSVSSSSSNVLPQSSHGSTSSVIFDDSFDSEVPKKLAPADHNGSHAIETVASLLSIGSLRRSQTEPSFTSYTRSVVAME